MEQLKNESSRQYEYMEEMKNICRNNRDNAEKFITEAMNLLENPNTIIPSLKNWEESSHAM